MPDGIQVGDTATNPQTGKKIRWDGKGWQPVGPSTYERLTAPLDPGAEAFDQKHPILGKGVRALSSVGSTVIGAPEALYHTATDKFTPEEEAAGAIAPGGAMTARLLNVIPIAHSAQDWAKMHPSVKEIMSVLPEALGQGVGNVAAGEATGEALRLGGKGVSKAVSKVQPALQQVVTSESEVNAARIEHEQELAKLDKDYEEQVQKVGKKTAQDEADYKLKVEQTKDTYAKKVAERNEKAIAQSAKESAATLKGDTFATKDKSGPAYKRLTQMADSVGQSVTKLDKTVREAYNARWNAFHQVMGDAEGNFEPVQQAVVNAENNILKGSPENIAIFRNILNEGEDPLLSQASVFKGGSRGVDIKEVLSSMKSEGERSRFLRGLQEEGVPLEGEQGAKEGATLPLDQIQGYSTELGNKIYRSASVSGDVRRALKSVKNAADMEVERVADSKGQGSTYRQLKKDWAQYMDDFYDHDGPLYKVKSAVNSDRRLSLMYGSEGSRIVSSLGHYSRLDPGLQFAGERITIPNLVGRVRSLVSQIDSLPSSSGAAPGKVVRPQFPERPSPREMPTPPGREPFSAPAFRREHIQKIAQNLSRITGWDIASIGYALRELFSGQPPWALGYPVGKRIASKLLSHPGVVDYLSREGVNVPQARQ